MCQSLDIIKYISKIYNMYVCEQVGKRQTLSCQTNTLEWRYLESVGRQNGSWHYLSVRLAYYSLQFLFKCFFSTK